MLHSTLISKTVTYVEHAQTKTHWHIFEFYKSRLYVFIVLKFFYDCQYFNEVISSVINMSKLFAENLLRDSYCLNWRFANWYNITQDIAWLDLNLVRSAFA